MPVVTYERILAGDIKPGDKVARARTHTFCEVESVRFGAKAIRLHFDGAEDARPQQTARWWIQRGE